MRLSCKRTAKTYKKFSVFSWKRPLNGSWSYKGLNKLTMIFSQNRCMAVELLINCQTIQLNTCALKIAYLPEHWLCNLMGNALVFPFWHLHCTCLSPSTLDDIGWPKGQHSLILQFRHPLYISADLWKAASCVTLFLSQDSLRRFLLMLPGLDKFFFWDLIVWPNAKSNCVWSMLSNLKAEAWNFMSGRDRMIIIIIIKIIIS